MTLKVNDLFSGSAVTTVSWEDKSIHVTWNPNQWTPAEEARWDQVQKTTIFGGSVLVEFVCHLVTKWDILGDWDEEAGKFVESDSMFPLSIEKVGHLPMLMLSAIVDKVTDEAMERHSGR